MRSHRTMFTSESVYEGHPDKVCDYIEESGWVYKPHQGVSVATHQTP